MGRLCADGLDEEEDSFDSLRKSFSWRTVGAAAGDIMNDAPSIDVMFGPMTSLKRKARVVQSRAKKVKIGELKKAGRVKPGHLLATASRPRPSTCYAGLTRRRLLRWNKARRRRCTQS